MDPRAARVRQLFAFATASPPGDVHPLLLSLTGDDPSLLAEVQALLSEDRRSCGLLDGQEGPSAGTNTSDGSSVGASADGGANDDGLILGARIAHYRLDEYLGEGGMGQVFGAWDLALGRPAAIKVTRRGFDVSFARRLLREVDACARLQHPGIATFFEGGEANGRAYFAMERVAGSTLRLRLRDGALPVGDALTVTAGLLEALAHAHNAGFLHRDIKPENIVLTTGGRPKLLDFGLARRLSDADFDDEASDQATKTTLTVHGAIPGTPGYMSPEQLRGAPLSAASDLFQVGLVLYEMLTGRRAYGGGSVVSRIAATLSGLPDMNAIDQLGRPGLGAMVRRALSPNVAERFATAGAFLLEIDSLLDQRTRVAEASTVAVFEFENQTGDPSNDWLGSGIADAIGATLSRTGALKVTSRARIQKAADTRPDLKGASSVTATLALGIHWALIGACQRLGPCVRVSCQLIEAATGREGAAGTVEGTMDTLFDLTDRVARVVIDGLKVAVESEVGRTSSLDPRVFELHAKARRLWANAGRVDPRTLSLLEEASALAPDYGPVLGTLCGVLASHFITSNDRADLHRAIETSERAIAVDPTNTEAWSWRAYAFFRLDRRADAMDAWHRSLALDPDDMSTRYFLGATHCARGDYETALVHLRHALTVDATFSMAWLALGAGLAALTRFEDARYAFSRARSLEGVPGPNVVAGLGGYIADCFRCEGRLEEARGEALEGVESAERSDATYRDTYRAVSLGALGRAALLQGDVPAADAAFSQAIAQTRNRSSILAGGHVLVHAMAGLARATGDADLLEDAVTLFEGREGFSFHYFFGCGEGFTLLELARTAAALGQRERARELLNRAREAKCYEPFGGREP